jgi:hypothetical protein
MEIVVPLAYGGIGPNQAEVFLMSDTAGLPGTIIESFAIQNLPFGDSAGLTMIQSVSRPLLNWGQQYWVAATGGPGTFALWVLTLFQGDPSDGAGHRIIWETQIRAGLLALECGPVLWSSQESQFLSPFRSPCSPRG